MKRTSRVAAFLVGVGLLVGCVDSVTPIYTDADLVFDSALLGVWTYSDSSAVYVVTEGVEPGYSVWFLDDDCSSWGYDMHLAGFGGLRLLNLQGFDPTTNDGRLAVQWAVLIDEQNDSMLSGRSLDPDWLNDLLDTVPDAIPHVRSPGVVLTAPPTELQDFYLRHVNTPDAFTDPDTLLRLGADDAERLVGRLILNPGSSRRGAPPPPPPPPGVVVDEDGQERAQAAVLPCMITERVEGR